VKRCTMCGAVKDLTEFYKYRKGYRAECISCCNRRSSAQYESTREATAETHAKWRRGNPDYLHGYHLLSKYGLTPAQYDALLESQNGCCAVCKEPETAVHQKTGLPRRLAVDHDHSCCPGERSCGACVRGLLCYSCNTGLGAFRDSVSRIQSALRYLEGLRK